jgi:20S proteasome subunit beta 7
MCHQITSASYGSLARFRGISRIHTVNNETVVAATGDYADFQSVIEDLTELQYVRALFFHGCMCK